MITYAVMDINFKSEVRYDLQGCLEDLVTNLEFLNLLLTQKNYIKYLLF